jgi:hypothetical protein
MRCAANRNVGSLIPDEVITLFDSPTPSRRAMGSTQSVTEMSTRNLPGRKGRPACKTDILSAVYEPIV